MNLHVYGLDRTNGQISNHKKVAIFDDVEDRPNHKSRFGSVECSPNSRFLYVAVNVALFHIDSWEDDLNNGVQPIEVYGGVVI